jgi:DNA polymerase (family 10)
MDKKAVAERLEEIGVLLELKGENPFKSRAYHNAARVIEGFEGDLAEAVRSGTLRGVKGIGEALFEKIQALVIAGRLPYLEELHASVPEGLFELLRVPGLGPKRVRLLHERLGIANLGELEYACNENRLLELEGFGEKSQSKILEGIRYVRTQQGMVLFPVAFEAARGLYEKLMAHPKIQRVSIAGSLRRRKEVVKDIDLVASSREPKAVMDFFVALPETDQVIAHGDTKSSIRLKAGINADLRIVSDEEYPYLLHHLTGSKEHNIAMRGRAQRMGIKMNEYGLWREPDGRKIPCRDEEEIFRELGLAFIPPEVREDTGEIAAAERHEIPGLLEEKDIRGIFHTHTTYSDGSGTLEAMVKAAQDLGYAYIGISDHSQSAQYANGLKPDRIRQQHREIEEVQARFRKIKIFKGIECDILADGSLDYTDEVLAGFEFVIASVHSRFNLSEEEQTQRVVKAMRHPSVTMVAHPTGRLLLSREGYKINLRKILEAAAEHGVIMELNASPYRLDLDWRVLKQAKELGVAVSINPDAHSTEGLADVRYGVGIARKGWLTRKDVFNTRTAADVTQALSRRRGA